MLHRVIRQNIRMPPRYELTDELYGVRALNDPGADPLLDATSKGIPHDAGTLRLSDIGTRGWNVLRGDCPLPLAVLRADVIAGNSAWMMAFARHHGLLLAPHGKTTMASALFQRQLRDGAWAITVATAQQLQVALSAGAMRVILANQPMGRAVDACFHALASHPGLELFVLADSLEGVAMLAARAQQLPAAAAPLWVLVEIGASGARTGCRDIPAAIAVARAVASAPGLQLAGVEGYEGVLPGSESIEELLTRVVDSARAIDSLNLFGAQIVLSAGGSAWFDVVAQRLNSLELSRPILRVLRSGCYLTHDHLKYSHDLERLQRERRVWLPPGGLQPALQLWAYVQSRPDPGKALLTMGKRDVGYDMALPQPIAWYRPGAMREPAPVPEGCSITGLNDQHAHLMLPAAAPIAVGDMIGIGIAHPCTTFERWQLLMLIDEQFNVVGAIRTCF
jgi:D-serine dehydratase